MNKPRLIDANELYKAVSDGKYTTGNIFKDMELQDFIKSMPTAYDIDKVVEQLKKFNVRKGCHLECTNYYPSVDRCNGDCHSYIKHKTIEIVKGGAG